MSDYYSLLGVSKTASEKEIKAAYRKAALKWHPDRNKESGAEAKFKEINSAYEVLSDSKKKALYDQVGHESYTKGGYGSASAGQSPWGNAGGGSGPFSYTYTSGGGNPFADFGFDATDPFDIFESFFGGKSRRPQKPSYRVQISFVEAVKGVTKEVNVPGVGNKSIKIPPGVDNDTQIRFTDFNIIVSVSKSEKYEREGQNLIIRVPISYTTAVLGGDVTFELVDGEKVTLRVTAGTTSGHTVRVKGKGIPYPNHPGQKGDLYVLYNIHVPKNISGDYRKKLEELAKLGS